MIGSPEPSIDWFTHHASSGMDCTAVTDQAILLLTQPPIDMYSFIRLFLFTFVKVFTVPLVERRFKDMNEHKFGDESEQAKICKDIMQRNGVTIEISLARDQSLTVVINGRSDNVLKARREVVSKLQTQVRSTLGLSQVR